MKQTIDKISNIIVSLTILAIVILAFQVDHIFNYRNLKVRKYERVSLNVPQMEYTLTKSEIKDLISDLYKTPHIYTETSNLNECENGKSYLIIRLVQIRENLSLKDYAIAYAHELTHVSEQIGDETYVTFKTFVTLYESGNAELQNMALRHAQTIINGGYAGTEYDCSFYIIEYLEEKGVI